MISSPDKKIKINGTTAKKQLVLFDFDGTITTRDTLGEFLKYYHGKVKYIMGLVILSPVIAAYVFKLMPNWKSKQYLLTWFLKNESSKEFDKRCREFVSKQVRALIRPEALHAISGYKRAGATIVVVSASAENWVKPWCDEQGLVCIATRLQVKENQLTGKILGKNCHGPEKVCRIQEMFNLSDYDEIIAYGDSSGDTEMLSLAHQKHFKPFRTTRIQNRI
jgi:phosphatidylglycerophosphatase C